MIRERVLQHRQTTQRTRDSHTSAAYHRADGAKHMMDRKTGPLFWGCPSCKNFCSIVVIGSSW
jgi:hypothetical protein